MVGKKRALLTVVSILFVIALFVSGRASAIEVKKHLDTGGGGGGPAPESGPAQAGPSQHNPLTKAQQQSLQESVAGDSDKFLSEESEKKSSGEPYLDLENAKFSYIPTGGGVTAKLTADEYKLKKGGTGKGKPTGNKKSLVFKYKLAGNKVVAGGEPAWEDAGAQKSAQK